jgi:hypothetical protein
LYSGDCALVSCSTPKWPLKTPPAHSARPGGTLPALGKEHGKLIRESEIARIDAAFPLGKAPRGLPMI